MESNLRHDFDVNAKYQVQTVQSLILAVNRLDTGMIADEKKQKLSEDLIRELRYGKEGYFWVDTKEGVNVVLLDNDAEGKNRIDLKDSKGTYLIKEIIENGQKPEGGYSDYFFSKKGSTQALPKRG